MTAATRRPTKAKPRHADQLPVVSPVLFVDIEERATVPAWVVDHATFRRWAYSDDFPERGRFSFLGNHVHVDLSMERDAHNKIKTRCGHTLITVSDANGLGEYYGDGMMVTHETAGVSNEPDGLFAKWATLAEGRLRLVGGADGIELEGTPDMVLEVVSPSSVKKDTVLLPELYWKAGIDEYWLIDPRGKDLRFDILQHASDGYRPARNNSGWRKSRVFDASFRLTIAPNRAGLTAYSLEVR